MIEWTASSEDDTARFGARLAAMLEPGSVVALVGDLGAGKTRLVRAVATGLGCDPAEVNSPTFVLIQQYAGRLPVYHFDTYRLADVDEFLELGTDELLLGDGVCLVEWADRVAEVLPEDTLRIEIEATGATERRLRITGECGRAARIVERLQENRDTSS